MVKLKKLLVLGIRSFGAEESQQQVLTFYPLTLILGDNGAGKTSLIEAIRYVASGDHPPGTNAGKTWIHDPDLLKKGGVVKAQIKLKFEDNYQKDVVVTRSLELTQKKDRSGVVKRVLRTLDGIIKRDNKHLPTRCAEIEREMVDLFGVSKAVLTNIVFCHQEDNNWPLSEGKVLKEKFDQIFGSIGYVKALAKIKKVRDEKVKEQKGLKAEEALNYEYKKSYKQKKAQEKKFTEDLDFQRIRQADINKKIKPVEQELDEIAKNINRLNDTQKTIANIRGKLQEKERTSKQLKSKITNILTCELAEAKQLSQSFARDIKTTIERESNICDKIADLDVTLENLSEEINNNLINKGKLEQIKKQHKEEIQSRNSLIIKFFEEKSICNEDESIDLSSISAKEVDYTSNLIKTKLKVLSSEMALKEEAIKNQITRLEMKLDSSKSEKTKLEEAYKFKESSRDSLRRELKKNESIIKSIASSLTDLDIISEKLKIKNKELLDIETNNAGSDIDSKIAEAKDYTKKLSAQKNKLNSQLLEAQAFVSSLLQYCKRCGEIIKKEKENQDSTNISNTQNLKTPEEIINEIKSVDKELEDKNSNLDNLVFSKNEISDKKNKLQKEINELESKKLQLEKKDQERLAVSDKIKEIEANLSNISESTNYPLEIEKISLEIKAFEKNKTDKYNEKEHLYKTYTNKIDTLRLFDNKLDMLNTSINNYIKSSKEDKLDLLTRKNEESAKKISLYQEERAVLEKDLKKVRDEISNEKFRERDLNDNISLLENQEAIHKLRSLLEEEEAELSRSDYLSLEKKQRKLNKLTEELQGELGQVKGEMRVIQKNIKDVEEELKRTELRKSDETYRQAVINHVSNSILCDDLNKYYKALDKAVSTYHVRKMEEINILIDHFWKQTYQAADILTIKIVCDDTEERAAADKKKSYNYRVVMVKEGTEMDMRGRCSAGQKVLASLVIRLALAQIFCNDCGILALDEPTTNLDESNIKALAKAISNIMEDQKDKLQLIIITHDEQFLNCLNEENEYYYRVYKDEEGHSRVEQNSIRERE